ncbi:complement factor H-like isoform X2 [Centropristis striata]|uniref:complement factor H-like isoform X2 n=1 Tax=Centropristis striata TaxID=184440 RepID=UPI0027E040B3|nr:complement factor H-like isoform X2 [Centropristis striata]
MDVIARSCVLFLWLQTLTFVTSQAPCTLQQFITGEYYDSNFDTTGMADSYPGGKQVRVPCNVGYSGFFKLVCIEGKWESRGTKCHLRPCGHPGDAQFGEFHLADGKTEFVFGSKVVYTCQKGYQMISRKNYRLCTAEGWDGTVPICEAQQCPVFRVDSNVQVIGDLEEATYGNVVQFSCKSRHEILNGSPELHCNEQGEWSGKVPTCKEITCPVPEIENGNVPGTNREYRENEVLRFECNEKFQPTEGIPSKCIKTGSKAEWSPTPLCELIKCKLTKMEATRYEPPYRNVFSPGETLTVYCARTSWISTPQETSTVTTCEANGQWSISPTCKEVTCFGRKPEHVNYWGVSSWRATKLDETISYSCQEGYKTSAVNKRAKCTRNGWTPNPPCEVITCRKENIPGAVIVDTDKEIYRNKEKVIYACGEGGRGRITRTCGADGWTGSTQCEVKPCPLPRKDPDGFFRGPYDHTRLYYTCNDGYKLSKEGWWAETKCVDEKWTELTPCIRDTDCGKFPEIPNAEVGPTHQSVQITCNQGYQAQANSFTCTGGNWDLKGLSPDEICKPIGPCGPPREVENAVVVTSYQKEYLSGSEVTYQCRNKYIPLEGVDKTRCTNGQWDREIECTLFCDKLEDITINFTANKEKYMDGENIKFECVVDGAEGMATCNNTKWVKSLKCTVKPCEGSAEIPNGRFEIIEGEELVFGTKIKYFCDTGYKMTSKETTRICLLNGWSNHVPTCEPVSCDPPTADGRLIVKGLPNNDNPILPRYSIDFSCSDPGSNLIGSERLVCGEDGQWDDPFPSCEEITCEVGVMPPHVDAVGLPPGTNTVKAGYKIQFECDNRRPVDGPAEIECLKTGEWSAGYPTCDDKCTLKDVSNTVRMTPRVLPNNQLRKGQKLRFACTNRGDSLLGEAEVECLEHGQWSHDFPTCGDALTCGKPPYLEDGDVTTSSNTEYSHGETVEYSCQNYYTMQGGPHKTCNNGEWIGSITCLKPCTANKYIMASNNIRLKHLQSQKLYSAHNDFIEFTCTRGRPVGRVGMRQRCVNGQMDFPTCE